MKSVMVLHALIVLLMLLSGHQGIFVDAQCGIEIKFAPADVIVGDELGYSVALHGDRAIVGAPGVNSKGAAFIVSEVTAGMWTEIVKLEASSAAADDQFGLSVAISGVRTLVGAPYDDYWGLNSGAAFVFSEKLEGEWTETQKLVASDGADSDYFASALSIDGENAFIGAWGDDDLGTFCGAAYIFFEVSAGVFMQVQKVLATDGAIADYFASSVALDGSNALLGAYGDDYAGSNAGAAVIFSMISPTQWNQTQKLTADDATLSDFFGGSVALFGTSALVGSSRDDDAGSSSGSAYLFSETSPFHWVQVQKLVASDGYSSDYFGSSVAMDDTYIVVGSSRDDDAGDQSGAAYLYKQQDGHWAEIVKFVATDGYIGDEFGLSVAVSHDVVLIGAYGSSSFEGAAYFLDLLSSGVCLSSPCLNEGSCVAILGDVCESSAFMCNCTGTGFEGDLCTTDVDDCASTPCMNGGTCLDSGANSFSCNCDDTGYYGYTCEDDVDDCMSFPCMNNGVCADDGENGFQCTCESGFQGSKCEHVIDDCSSAPCLHEGTCVNDLIAESFRCICTDTYQGLYCDVAITEGSDDDDDKISIAFHIAPQLAWMMALLLVHV